MKGKGVWGAVAVLILLIFAVVSVTAQYRGAPVKKDRLIKALRSKQLQTRDIVDVIISNGVDFELNEETRKALIAAGARPEVIKAVAENHRIQPTTTTLEMRERNIPTAPTYEELLNRATLSYKERGGVKISVQQLEDAIKLDPKKPAAYQILGFIKLYGLNDAVGAERLMQLAINNGGSAVFRVYHDDSGGFSKRCSGSLYISPQTIRFESDDNRHTFETKTVNIDRFKLDAETNREWTKRSVFNVFLKFGKEKTEFRFAPVSGRALERAMVERFIYIARNNITFLLPSDGKKTVN